MLWDYQGGAGFLPTFLRELGGGQQGHGPLTFRIPGRRALTPVRGSPFPRNGRRGCLVLQSSSSWQSCGCQGLPELALAVSMATVGALAPSAAPRGGGRGLAGSSGAPPPERSRLCPQDSRGAGSLKFLHASPLHAPTSFVPSLLSPQVPPSAMSFPWPSFFLCPILSSFSPLSSHVLPHLPTPSSSAPVPLWSPQFLL